jgi:hypothetical protein
MCLIHKRHRGIIRASILFIISEFCIIYFSTRFKIDPNVIGVSVTSVGVIFGYFITHHLETISKEQEKKSQQYWELMKAMRVFKCEYGIGSQNEEAKHIADSFLNSYVEIAPFISKKVDSKIRDIVILRDEYFHSEKEEQEEKKSELNNAIKIFVNCVREELSGKEKIDFESYTLFR